MLNDAMKDNPELRSVSERFFQQVSQRIKVFLPRLVVTLFSFVALLLLCLFYQANLSLPSPSSTSSRSSKTTSSRSSGSFRSDPSRFSFRAAQQGELVFSEFCQSDSNKTVPSPLALQVYCILGQQHPQALCISHPREDCETRLRCDGDLPSSGPLQPLQLRQQQQQQQKVKEAMSLLYAHVPP